jgi:hypothetical protein
MQSTTYLYMWEDGRAVYIGRSAYPRERRGQHRSAARKGSTTRFHAYLREKGVSSGRWHTQEVSVGGVEALEAQWLRAAEQSGALVLNEARCAPAPTSEAEEYIDHRPALRKVRSETAYLDTLLAGRP